MHQDFFSWGAISFLIIILCSLLVGYDMISSCKNKDKNYQVEYVSKTGEPTSKSVESTSKTNEKFYKKMVEMERDSTLIFDGFPTCLTDILILRKQPGEEVFSTETDTLYLFDRDLNRYDINRYVYYLFKDNHGNLWSLFRHNETFRLTREDEIKCKKLLEVKTKKE